MTGGGNVPSRVSYVERIGERGAVDVLEGVRARGLSVCCEVREGCSEGLQQLLVRLLRIGAAGGSVSMRVCKTTGSGVGRTYRLRNMASSSGASAVGVNEHREGVE